VHVGKAEITPAHARLIGEQKKPIACRPGPTQRVDRARDDRHIFGPMQVGLVLDQRFIPV